jgi:hypothetical protein
VEHADWEERADPYNSYLFWGRELSMRSENSELYATQKLLQFAIVIVLITGVVGSSMAANDSRQQKTERGLSNFAYEVIECASYYSISADWLYRGGKFQDAQKATEINEYLFQVAREFTSPETFQTRLNLVRDDQIDSSNSDYKDLSILISRHHKRCEYLYNNLETRMQQYVAKEFYK